MTPPTLVSGTAGAVTSTVTVKLEFVAEFAKMSIAVIVYDLLPAVSEPLEVRFALL